MARQLLGQCRRGNGLNILPECLEEFLFPRAVERAGLLDQADSVCGTAVKRIVQALPERGHDRQRERVQETGLDRQDQGHLVGKPQGRVLRLLEDGAIRARGSADRGPVYPAFRQNG